MKIEIEERKEKSSEETQENYSFGDSEPSLRDGENPKFLNASNAVNFRYDSSNERSVVATKDIEKGDVLFIENPYAHTALHCPKNRFTLCSFCLKHSLNCEPCPTCTTIFYCSDECQSSAWESSHKWLCYNERYQIITDIRLNLALSIILKASHEGFKTQIEDTSIYGNKDNNHPFMNLLLTHFTRVTDSVLSCIVKGAVWIVMYLKYFTSYFTWLYDQPNHPKKTKENMINFVGGYLVKYLLQICFNVDYIEEAYAYFENNGIVSLDFRDLGLGIYLSSALLNHSCLPNARVSYQGSLKIVKALKDMKQGTEITISYIGEENEVEAKERQIQLRKFMVQCTCLRCKNPNYDQIYKPYLCPECRGKAYLYRGKTAAKCTTCSFVFKRNKSTKEREAEIKKHLSLFEATGDVFHKNALYEILRNMYHKDGIIYIAFHDACLKHYKRNDLGDIEKWLDTIKSLIATIENVYGNSSEQYIFTMIAIMQEVVDLTYKLEELDSKLYKKFFNAKKIFFKKTFDSLRYFVCPRNINLFVD